MLKREKGALVFALAFLIFTVFPTEAKQLNCGETLRSVIPKYNTALRNLVADVIKTYKAEAAPNENLKHVRRLVSWVRSNSAELLASGIDPSILEAGIYISDMAKNTTLLARYKEAYGGDFLKAMLEHAQHSLQEADLLRKKEGRQISENEWQKIQEAIIGHDGPSLPGTWWHQNYGGKLGREYPDIVANSKEGYVHAIFDRLDQGGIYRDKKGEFQGGLRKISFDELKFKQNDVALALEHVFTKTHQGSALQIENLLSRADNFFPAPQTLPAFIKNLLQNFKSSPQIFSSIKIKDGNINFSGKNNLTGEIKKNPDGTYSCSTKDKKGKTIQQKDAISANDALTFFWESL